MRRIGTLLIVLLACSAAAQETQPPSFFARSQHYSMNVDVVPGTVAGSIIGFNVTVVDLATNAVVAQPHIIYATDPAEMQSETDAGDVHIRIAARPFHSQLSTSLEVSKGETVVDSIHAVWALQPFPKRERVMGGVIGG